MSSFSFSNFSRHTASVLISFSTVISLTLSEVDRSLSILYLYMGPEQFRFKMVRKQEPELSAPTYSDKTSAKHDTQSEEDDRLSEDNDSRDLIDIVQAEQDKFGKPYNPEQELPPDLPAYHSSFAKVEKLCAEIFSDAVTLLEASEYKDEVTKHLLESIDRRQAIKYDKPKRVGFIGDSGVGKHMLQLYRYPC